MAEWRKKEKMDLIPAWEKKHGERIELSKKLYPSCICGDDKYDRPIVVARMGMIPAKEFVETFTKEEWDMHHKWRMEKTIELLRKRSIALKKPITQLIVILDMEGIGFPFRHMMPYMKMTSAVDKQNYPEIVGNIFCVNTPWIVPVLFRVISPFIDARTKEKIIVSAKVDPKAFEVVGEEVMPKAYGGKSPVELPGGDAKKKGKEKEGEDDDLAVNRSVAAGGNYTFVKKCSDPRGGKYIWAMKLRAYDVSLRIAWTPDGAEEATSVANVEKVAQHEGEFEVKSAGSLHFTFDNSYSYFRSKEVQCAIEFFPTDAKEAA
uniref:CRAL-TRIO domain-containing protein n=1 Tax=Lotharella oceanica TaxID=641309 RepID=A0A7S2TSC1_9EUKA